MKFKLLLLCSFVVMSSQVSTAMNQAAAGKVVAGKKVRARQAPAAKQEDSKDKSFAEAAGAAKAPETKLSEAAQPAAASAEVSLAAAVVTVAAVAAEPSEAPATPKAASAAAAPAVANSAAESSKIKVPGFGFIAKTANWAKGTPERVMGYLAQAEAEKKHIDMQDNETSMVISSAIAQIVAEPKGQESALKFLEAAGKQVNDEPVLRLSRAQRQSLRAYLKPHLQQQSAILEADDEAGYKERTAKREFNFANVHKTLKAVNLTRTLKDVRDPYSSDEEDASLPEKEAFGIEKARVAITKRN